MNEVVSAAWDKVTEEWSNQARHDALLQLAVAQNELRWVATRYREKKGDPVADAQLVRLQNAAMATMFASAKAKQDEVPSMYKRAIVWIIVLLIMLVAGLLAAKLVVSAHHPARP